MKIDHFPFHETGQFTPLILDYLNGKDAVSHLYKYPPSYDIIPRIMEEKQNQEVDRETLVAALKETWQSLAATESTKRNIDLLKQENTYTITTAHQPVLLTGPLYFVIKIACTIKMTQELQQQYPDYHFVPVYWMGGEDHDFDEVNHFHIFGNRLEWHSEAGGPVGRMTLKGIDSLIEQLAAILDDRPEAGEFLELVRSCYSKGKTLGQATMEMVNALFGKYGLVIVDADRRDLKQLLVPVMEEELFGQKSKPQVEERIKMMEEHGYHQQAHARNINLFYFKNGFRERIEYNEDDHAYEVVNTHLYFDDESLREELHTNPDCFSPNVILRPVYQETVLPNLAYVGGAGEISYWMQLEGVFELHKVNFPMLVVRNSLLVIDKTARKKLDNLEIPLKKIFEDEDALIKQYVKGHAEDELSLADEKRILAEQMERVKQKAAAVEQTLTKSVEAEEQKIENALGKLEAKILRAEKKKFDTAINQIKWLKSKLLPEGKLHERHDNLANFYLRFGSAFIDEVVENMAPLKEELVVMEEE